MIYETQGLVVEVGVEPIPGGDLTRRFSIPGMAYAVVRIEGYDVKLEPPPFDEIQPGSTVKVTMEFE